MTAAALALGLVLGFLARHKMKRSAALDPRRQLAASCVALRQGGYRVKEHTLGRRTIITVDDKGK